MAHNLETLVLKPFAMTWVLNTTPEWCCGNEKQNLVSNGSNDA
jgi:hypothetical protein